MCSEHMWLQYSFLLSFDFAFASAGAFYNSETTSIDSMSRTCRDSSFFFFYLFILCFLEEAKSWCEYSKSSRYNTVFYLL